ncbi:hypothetical protein LQV63_09955 [Paenibacillus profundus]|uniref:WxL domain-containing protein n=1 Tax=Paenibacillus profundus TaxID=1173085 RepID=A0ABS8YDC2_9BACL|nr:hypothetical protein [Paenibacillus profundus]MCE5169636.1 hypothetical protein [Paenibacillus profundus]
MTQPIISWLNSTHSAEVTAPFDFGVIDAGDSSRPVTFNIWNNKNGKTDVSKMEDCTITTREMEGGLETQVVSGNWFHAQVDSLGETDIADPSSLIGKTRLKPIGTTWSTTKDHSGKELTTPLTPAAQEILGVNNNGNPLDAAGNYVTVSLQAEIPLDASSGRQDFKIRVSYRYM